MAKRIQRQLKKQLEEQKNLEEELDKLQNGKDPKDSCAEVIKFVQSTSMDPMPDTDNNPFAANCFIAGTQILVNKSGKHKNIEEIQVGDKVICMIPTHATFKESIDCDIKDIPKLLCDAVVTAIHCSFASHTCSIKYRNLTTNEECSVICTDSHPIYVNKQGWKTVSGQVNANSRERYDFEIKPLKINDQVCLETGQIASITHIDHMHLQNPVLVYNLTASKVHTFFANGLLVHNKGCDKCIIL
jgi:ribosomal protein L31